MILNTIFRILWVTIALMLAVGAALGAVIAGEVLRIRSWMYYVLAGGASLVAIPLLTSPRAEDIQALPASPYMPIFAAAGFVGGFVYWLLAGARA